MNEVNNLSRMEMLKNRIRRMKQEAVDLDFIKYLNDTEESINKGEYSLEQYENLLERNYNIYLQKNAQVLKEKRDFPTKDSFEFSIGAGVLSVVGVLFILAGLSIFAVNYLPDFVKGFSIYVISIVVILLSEFLIKKKAVKLANVLTGVGICGIYVATIVNFDNLHAFVTIAIVVITSLVTLILGKTKNSITFKFISLLGSYICLFPTEGVEDGWAFVTICMVLFFIHLTSLLIPQKNPSRGFMITGMIWNIIYLLVFTVMANYGGVEAGFVLVHIVLAAIVFYVHALKTPFRKDGSTTVFLIIGTFIYYLVFTNRLQNLLVGNELYYVAIILCVYIIIQLVNRIKAIPSVAAAAMIATFFSYVDMLNQDALYSLIYLGVFMVSVLLIRNWKLLYEFIITAAFLLYPLVYSKQWSVNWQTELNILICSGVMIAFFMIFNHAKWLESPNIKVYNIINISILGILQLSTMACDNAFVFSFMLVVGLIIFSILFQERYHTAIPKKDVWVIVYLTYMGIVFPVECFAATNIIMTIIALCSVVIGFYKKEKAIRIYGLLLALFICAKIVIYDYRTVSQMYRMLLFLGVGVIILAISFVYMRLEKRLQNEQ